MSLYLYLEVAALGFFLFPVTIYSLNSCLLRFSSVFSFADTVVVLKANELFTSTFMIYMYFRGQFLL